MEMKKILQAIAAVALLLLAGCSASPKRGPDGSRLATQVFVGNCITVEKQEGAGATLAAAIITQGINRIGQTLEESAKEKTWPSSGATNFEARTDVQPRCVQIVRGHFYPAKSKPGSWSAGTEYAAYANQFETRGIHLAGKPDFFFEGLFRGAQDKVARAVVPAAIGYHSPLGSRAFRWDKGRATKLTLVFHAAGKPANDATNAMTELDLGVLWPGPMTKFNTDCAALPTGRAAGGSPDGIPDQPRGAPPPQPGGSPPDQPAVGTADKGGVPSTPEDATRACSAESLWFRSVVTDQLAPMSLTATISQTQDRSDVLGFFADVFKSSQADLEALAKQELISSEREKARRAEQEAQAASTTAYLTAATTALQALESCSNDGKLATRSAALLAQISANLAAEKAGQRRPFADAVMPKLGGTEAEAKTACSNAINRFA